MKWVRWARFSWDVTDFTPVYPAIDQRYSIREATAEDEKAVRSVVQTAFSMDSHWAFLLRVLAGELNSRLDSVFGPQKGEKAGGAPLPCLVVTHGNRIIGASALSLAPEAENHLLTGPCILMEYRSRGLATALLGESLAFLKREGLKQVNGMTRKGSPTEKFLYVKFQSQSAPFNPIDPADPLNSLPESVA